MKIGIIIQARMGSSRLPGKVLKKIGPKVLLEHIIYRLDYLKHQAQVVIATSDLEKDNPVEAFCFEREIDCFRGAEQNVLERYYLAAKKFQMDHIVRLTADNPFLDIEELDRLIELHISSQADYSRSFSTLPKGVGSEIFSYVALEKSYKFGLKPNHIEHVNEYIEENEEQFKISELTAVESKYRPELSLTVDTPEDYKKACFIVEHSKTDFITTQQAIQLCLQYV